MKIDELFIKRWELSELIRQRNEGEKLDTPEQRFEALGRRMKEAKLRERLAIEAEAQRKIIVVDILEWQHDS